MKMWESLSDPTLWVFLAVVAFLFLLTFLGVWKLIGEKLDQRSDNIRNELDEARRLREEAQTLLASYKRRQKEAEAKAEEAEKAYETSLKDARAKANNVAESTRKSVDEEVARELAAADAEADQQAELAEVRIREIKQGALANLDVAAADVAATLVAELTGKTVTPAAARAAVAKV